MTRQELIDYWQIQINNHESAQQFLSSTLQIERHKAQAELARIIYMQLVTMTENEPVVHTHTTYDCSVSGISPNDIVINSVNSQP